MGNVRPTSIGGQAVIEGVMMRGPKEMAIAVRKSDGEIIIEKKPSTKSWIQKFKLNKIPILRGVLAFFESMIIGINALTFSAQFFEDEEEEKEKKSDNEEKKTLIGPFAMAITIIVSLAFSIGLFILLPNFVSSLITPKENTALYNLIEIVLRMAIFLGYIIAVSKMKDIRRVFEYHGAEHKTIFCYEHGEELNVENVKKYGRFHPRCGTSFLVFVMIVSFIIFSIIGRADNVFLNLLYRLLLLPVVAGLSYEIIKFAGRHSEDNKIVAILIKPRFMASKTYYT